MNFHDFHPCLESCKIFHLIFSSFFTPENPKMLIPVKEYGIIFYILGFSHCVSFEIFLLLWHCLKIYLFIIARDDTNINSEF